MKRYFIQSLLAFSSGVMASLVLPSDFFAEGLTLLVFIAVVPLFIAVYRSKCNLDLLWIAIIFGSTHTLIGRYWLAFFQDFSYIILVALSIGLSGVSFLILLLIRRTRYLRASSRIWAVAWLWGSFEYVRSIGFLADPWALLSYGFGQSRYIIQIIDITGVIGLSFLIGLSNALWAQWILLPSKNYLYHVRNAVVAFISIIFISTGYGIWQVHGLRETQELEHEAHILLVQQDMDSWNVHWYDLALAHMEAIEKNLPLSIKPDLIVSSETTLLGDFKEIMNLSSTRPQSSPLLSFIKKMDTYQLYGSMEVRDYFSYNSAFLIDKEARLIGDAYHKQKLIPFAEHWPGVKFAWIRNMYRKWFGASLFQIPGNSSIVFEIPLHNGGYMKFGVPICFEDAFPSVARSFVRKGAQLFINITNDSWSKRLSAQTQHMSIGRYRSIETKRPTLRAANSGMTVHINTIGDYQEILPAFERNVLLVPLMIKNRPLTFYSQYGEWFSYITLIISTAYFFLSYSQLPVSSLFSCGKNFFRRLRSAGSDRKL